ncbi:hypothetical protein ABL78_7283 [Leptomonas seymouri]|uniref:Uncharacterized protein n=1 Tax=Leptomonas seymouri TaxID=5684 RepID=A0A0N1I0U8_LEPSE|nr:hypothetical protein ABL78_7283 [Leptomonas seymouri]|eukprot:KPI83673.1 hypothetical protein ABL78_7283 [Leptomonas seymouri]
MDNTAEGMHRHSSLATRRGSEDVDELTHSNSFTGPRQRQHTSAGLGTFDSSASANAPPAGPPLHGPPPSSGVSSSSSSADSEFESDSESASSTYSSSSSASHRGCDALNSRRATQIMSDDVTATTTASVAKTDQGKSGGAGRWIRKKLIPQFMSEYGKSVYGGSPLAQQTFPGVFNYPSPFLIVPFFFVFMIPFVVVGALILIEGPRHGVVEQEYSHIHQYQYVPTNPEVNINEGLLKFTADGVTHAQGTRTWLQLNVPRHLNAPVYMYYKLDNFYQNFRSFHDGRSNKQLTGKQRLGNIYTCKPYTQPGFREKEMDTPISFTGADGVAMKVTLGYFTYSPCGIAPWSKFNDTFVLYRQLTADEAAAATAAGETVHIGGLDGKAELELVCNGTDFGLRGEPLGGSAAPNHCAKDRITWKADRDVRFHNMTIRQDWWSLYYPYPTDNEYLRNGWYLHEPGHALPDQSDYDLQVWMRSSFTSSFRKLYRIISVDLRPGIYWVDITELYDVVSFRGRKSIVLHDGNWTGGRNVVLGVVFVVMGCLSFVFGVAFTVECLLQRRGVNRYEHLKEPKRSWYVFPPDDPQFAHYYQLRLRRRIPMAQLQALRKTVEELEELATNSQSSALARQQS